MLAMQEGILLLGCLSMTALEHSQAYMQQIVVIIIIIMIMIIIAEHYISSLCNQYLEKSNRAISTTLLVCMLKTMYNNNIFSLQQIKIHLKW